MNAEAIQAIVYAAMRPGFYICLGQITGAANELEYYTC